MVEKAMIPPNEPPDELTPLLQSQGATPLEAQQEQIVEAPIEEIATADDDLVPESPHVTEGTEPDPEPDDRSWTGLPRWLGLTALLALFLGVSTFNIENSFVLTAYLKIGSDLGDQQHAAWLTQAFQIGVIVARPFYGLSADTLGRMKPLLASYCFFTFGVMLCGTSSSIFALISSQRLPLVALASCRLVVGIGSAGMGMLVSVILNDWTRADLSKRASWESVIKLAVIAGQFAGESLGGPFEDSFGWQLAFVFPCMLAFVSLMLAYWKLRRTPVNEQFLASLPANPATMSWDFVVGGLLVVTFAACLCLFPQFVSIERSLRDPWTYLVLCCLVIFGFGFVWHQCKTQTKRLVDFGLICQSPFWQIFLATSFREGATAGLQFLIPWYSVATGKEPLSRTFFMVGLSSGSLAGGLLAHAFFVKWKAIKYIYINCVTVCALAACIMSFRWSYTDSLWEACFYIFLFGLGSSAASATFLVGMVQETKDQDQARMYGSKTLVTDIAILGSISVLNCMLPVQLSEYMRLNLGPLLPPVKIEELIKACKSDLTCTDGLLPEVQQAIRLSLKEACTLVLVLPVVCTWLSAGCGALSKDIKLRTGRFDRQRARLAAPEEGGEGEGA